ncbi:response regulator [Erythrobacter crassostreae]|uniref:Response regulator n=1 Tax=Erythrobacter crassostreae TaxID=2828328 RepID=A0A9X1F0D6_9SPHN|nr:response regulator [Erythrobacter crassostrea]MBV7258031.1 response regulator [Erythrobacter crassostrea]
MTQTYRLLLVEDEPLILMDLEFAAGDRDCTVHCASTCARALAILEETNEEIDVAVLDVSLGRGETCFPIADALRRRGIPFILHSGDLDRHDELIRTLDAPLIAKPASAEKVIGAAIACVAGNETNEVRLAAE